MTVNVTVPSGSPTISSGGLTSGPSQVNRAGIDRPSSNDGEIIVKGGKVSTVVVDAGAAVVVVVEVSAVSSGEHAPRSKPSAPTIRKLLPINGNLGDLSICASHARQRSRKGKVSAALAITIGRLKEKNMSANPIVHWELMGADGESQKAFYGSIFDWEFDLPEGFDNYYLTSAEATGVGGAVGQGNEHMPSYAAIYVQVDDIEISLGDVESNGGSTVVPRTEIPGTVTFALFNDPAGNLVGLVEAATPAAAE